MHTLNDTGHYMKDAAHAEIGNKDEQQHNSMVTGIVKGQSLWSKALNSKDLDAEHEMLSSTNFQANALDTISKASCAWISRKQWMQSWWDLRTLPVLFGEHHLKAVFTTEDISNDLGKVDDLEKMVGYDADVAKAQSTQTHLEHLRMQLETINNTMIHIQPELHNIQDWLEGRLEGTGKWLLERQDCRMWISSSISKLLLLQGIHKSPHASFIWLDSSYKPNNLAGASKTYIADQKKQGQNSSQLCLSERQQLLVQLTDIYPWTTIGIDALDEVIEDKWIHLLNALKYVIAQSKNLVKIFAMPQMDHAIIVQFPMFPRIELQPDDNVSDINQFVKARVQSTIDHSQLLSGDVSDELQIEICEMISSNWPHFKSLFSANFAPKAM
ncbi:hypothetical protein FPQ18DRAFT_304644 [Pyronema domesticum]|nr:hypothetical protein FPQ18DRAFT_304644 [Pyronema domesticum]